MKTPPTPFRTGLLLPLCVWLAFVLLPVAWMLATHDGPESFWQCMERVYAEAAVVYNESVQPAEPAPSP